MNRYIPVVIVLNAALLGPGAWGQYFSQFGQRQSKLVLFAPLPPEEIRSGEALEKALDEPITADLDGVSCREVIDAIGKRCNIKIGLDPALAPPPVRYSCLHLPLRDALTGILGQSGLVWKIRDGAVFVTGEEGAYETKVYAVGDLVAVRDRSHRWVTCRNEQGEIWDDYDTLIDMIESSVEWGNWQWGGGIGTIQGGSFGKAKVLVVSQTYKAHDQIGDIFGKLRAIAKKHPGGEPPIRTIRKRRPRQPPMPAFIF